MGLRDALGEDSDMSGGLMHVNAPTSPTEHPLPSTSGPIPADYKGKLISGSEKSSCSPSFPLHGAARTTQDPQCQPSVSRTLYNSSTSTCPEDTARRKKISSSCSGGSDRTACTAAAPGKGGSPSASMPRKSAAGRPNANLFSLAAADCAAQATNSSVTQNITEYCVGVEASSGAASAGEESTGQGCAVHVPCLVKSKPAVSFCTRNISL